MDPRKIVERIAIRTAESIASLSEAEVVIEHLQRENKALSTTIEQLSREIEGLKNVSRGIYAP